MAVESVLGKESSEFMRLPNNILGIEYIKRIIYWENQGVKVPEAVSLRRYGSGYFDEKCSKKICRSIGDKRNDEKKRRKKPLCMSLRIRQNSWEKIRVIPDGKKMPLI